MSRTSPTDRTRDRWKPSDSFGSQGARRNKGGGAPLGRLKDVPDFGVNPGALAMLAYAPADLTAEAPLVVVLHGCSQDARGYDSHAGWTALAEEHGFAVLYPEQRKANNPGNCFNWFQTADAARGLGETQSIRAMIETMCERHRVDRSRIFVTGLSAGGAMAAALLADYPDVFAGGAIIAGLPCGAAVSMREAFQAMSRPADRSAEQWGDLVREGSAHDGPWPVISIWHGAADATVSPANADALVDQWLDVHGASKADVREESSGGHRRRVWRVGDRDVVEDHRIAGMGHGTPLDARLGERAGPFMLEAGVSSTRSIAAFWGVADAPAKVRAPHLGEVKRPAPEARAVVKAPAPSSGSGFAGRMERPAPTRRRGFDVGETITSALRAAGLMK